MIDVLLPVGISFYVFQALGYSIDVFRGDIKAEKNFITYALFVSFFPQLVAGPIERSANLLRQFKESKKFDYEFAMSGFKLMLLGYIMKLCMADRAAIYVDAVFNNVDNHIGYSSLIASFLFSLQIYGDFAGYTYIAIGSARIMGFSLHDNFARPYFSHTITDFWRRWHISLSSWLRDYIYIPMGGSRMSKVKTYCNLMVTFFVSGIWHGANWTYVIWGVMHGISMCVERLIGWNRKQWHILTKAIHVLLTFLIVDICWVMFRANTVEDAMTLYGQIFDFSELVDSFEGMESLLLASLTMLLILCKEIIEEKQVYIKNSIMCNYIMPAMLLLYICIFGFFDGGQFIYFQF